MGLRALFFLVAGLVQRFAYLQTGLGVLLIAIAGKLAYGELTGEKIPTVVTLVSIAARPRSSPSSPRCSRSGAAASDPSLRRADPPCHRIGLWALCTIVPLAFGLWAQLRVKRTFARYSKVAPRNGMSGAQAAAAVLQSSGLPGPADPRRSPAS